MVLKLGWGISRANAQISVPLVWDLEFRILMPRACTFCGILTISIIVGMLAISSAFIATMASVVVFGVLLVVEGITGVIHAIMVRTWKGFAMNLLVAALYLLGGFFMLEEPVRAA